MQPAMGRQHKLAKGFDGGGAALELSAILDIGPLATLIVSNIQDTSDLPNIALVCWPWLILCVKFFFNVVYNNLNSCRNIQVAVVRPPGNHADLNATTQNDPFLA